MRGNVRGDGTVGGRGPQHAQSDGIGDSGTLGTVVNVPAIRARGRGRGLQNIAQVTVTVPVQDVPAIRARGRGCRGIGRGTVQMQTGVVDSGQAKRGNVQPKRARARGGGAVGGSADEFDQSTSVNLPRMSFMKVADYFKSLRSSDLRPAKDQV